MSPSKKPHRPNNLPSDVEQVLALLEEKGTLNDYKVELRRRDPVTAEYEHLTSLTPQVFSIDYIRKEYGGGDYEAAIRHLTNKQYVKRPRFKIAGLPLHDSVSPPAPASSGSSPDVQALRAEFTSMKDVLLALANRPDPPPPPPSKLEEALSAILPVIVEKMLDRKEPKSVSPDKMVDLFIQGMKMGQDNSSDDGYAGVVKSLGQPLLSMLGAQTGQHPVPPSGGLPPLPPPAVENPLPPAGEVRPAPTPPAPAPPTTSPISPNPGDDVWQRMGSEVPKLVMLAQGGANPATWGSVVVETLHPSDLELIQGLMEDPGWPETFFAKFPGTHPHRIWFTEFLDHMQRMLFEDDVPAPATPTREVDPVGRHGDQEDPRGNEAPGPDGLEEPSDSGARPEPVGVGSPPEGNGVGGP